MSDSTKKHEVAQTHRVWVNAVSGATGSVMAKSCLAPIQRIVVLQQLGDNSHLSAIQIARKIIHEEGIAKGFWRGNLTSALQRIPYGGLQLAVYDTCKGLVMNLTGETAALHHTAEGKTVEKKNQDGTTTTVTVTPAKKEKKHLDQHLKGLFSKAVAGGLSAGIAGSMVYPLEVIRTRLMSGDERYRSMLGTANHIWHETNGPRNFFRGLNASLIQRVPDILLNFVVFETFKFEMLDRGYSDVSCIIVGGAAAALTSIAFTFPLDIAKRRIAMAKQLKSGVQYRGTLDALSKIFVADGVRGLYAGAKLDCVRCVPQVIMMWFFIEKTREFLNDRF